jgi:hypothetical protein
MPDIVVEPLIVVAPVTLQERVGVEQLSVAVALNSVPITLYVHKPELVFLLNGDPELQEIIGAISSFTVII